MSAIASEITTLTIVYSTVYSDADQRKHQSSASLAFVWGIHRDRWIPRTKGQLRGKCFHLMTSSCDVLMRHLLWSIEVSRFWWAIPKNVILKNVFMCKEPSAHGYCISWTVKFEDRWVIKIRCEWWIQFLIIFFRFLTHVFTHACC